MKPVIAITPAGKDQYAKAVELAGGEPQVLPLTEDRGALDGFLDGCDGLMLTGGGDVNPRRYGGQPHPKLFGVNDVRDAMEIHLAREAARRDLPVLGICRGIQVINVAFGGTLIPHLDGHQCRQPDAMAHEIVWVRDGLLKQSMAGFVRVNTSHHQAVDRVAEGFDVVAKSTPDGVVEAMEKTGARYYCAVQFHPERMVEVAPAFRGLFAGFVGACGGR